MLKSKMNGFKNGYSGKPVDYKTDYKVLSLSSTTSGIFDPSKFKYLDEPGLREKDIWCSPGDLLLQRGNTLDYVGMPAIVNISGKQFIFPDLMIRLRVNTTVLNLYYIYHILMSQFSRNYFRNNATGTAGNMPKINHEILSRMPIPLAPVSIQWAIVQEIERRFALVEKMESTIQESLQKAELLRQSILQKAFSGELLDAKEWANCRKEADWEPAEKLLERVKKEFPETERKGN